VKKIGCAGVASGREAIDRSEGLGGDDASEASRLPRLLGEPDAEDDGVVDAEDDGVVDAEDDGVVDADAGSSGRTGSGGASSARALAM
jgi:hypothetical protein